MAPENVATPSQPGKKKKRTKKKFYPITEDSISTPVGTENEGLDEKSKEAEEAQWCIELFIFK